MTIRLLEEDERQLDLKWYAKVENEYSHDDCKEINFFMFDPIDWKHYTAYYAKSNDRLTFSSDCEYNEKVTVSLIRKMVNFIDSDDFKNLVIVDDGEYHEYIFEI